MKIELPLLMPQMPNFLRIDTGPVRRESGISEKPTLPVADMTDEQVEEFINEWAEAFRQHVKTRRELRETIDKQAARRDSVI